MAGILTFLSSSGYHQRGMPRIFIQTYRHWNDATLRRCSLLSASRRSQRKKRKLKRFVLQDIQKSGRLDNDIISGETRSTLL